MKEIVLALLLVLPSAAEARRHRTKRRAPPVQIVTEYITCPEGRHLTTMLDGQINMILECRLDTAPHSETEGSPRVVVNCRAGQKSDKEIPDTRKQRGRLVCK